MATAYVKGKFMTYSENLPTYLFLLFYYSQRCGVKGTMCRFVVEIYGYSQECKFMTISKRELECSLATEKFKRGPNLWQH